MYSREELPQISDAQMPEFLQFCKDHGVSSEVILVPVAALTPIQKHLNKQKIQDMARKPINKSVLISIDNDIVDGHHTWMAAALQNVRGTVSCTKVFAPVEDIIRLGHEFEGSFRASIQEMLAMYRDMQY